MAMSNLQIAPQVPSEFTPAIPSTSSDFVVSRRMREYVADSQTSFSFNSNNIIKFTLNSADAFLDGRNSWLQFTLQAPVAAAVAGLSQQEAASRFLETGGAHSLFSRLRISLSNGTIISDYDYSQLYAMIRQHTMSFQHLQYQEGLSSYDGAASDIYDYGCVSQKPSNVNATNSGVIVSTPFTLAEVAAADIAAAVGGVQVLTIANASTNLRVGDEVVVNLNVQIAADLPSCLSFRVVTIPNAGSAGLAATHIAGGVNAAKDYGIIVGGRLREIQVIRRGDLSHRYRGATGAADADAVLCKMKLFSDFFNNIKYLPLPFLRNLTIELTLNRPAHSVVFAKNVAAIDASTTFAWTLKNPVIVANLVTPSESLMNAYVDQYNSEQGIMLHWIDYQSNKIGSPGSPQNESLRIPSNCHSALAVLVACKPPEAQAVVLGTTWYNDTNGNSLKMGISSYQFQCGSEYFPFARPVDTSLTNNGNAWNYVLQALDSHGAKYECSSIIPNEYYAVNDYVRVAGVITGESLRFYMAARLDRDGNYTGIDTSNNDIQLNISRTTNRNAGLADSYYHCFLVHNRLMRISKASSIVFS